MLSPSDDAAHGASSAPRRLQHSAVAESHNQRLRCRLIHRESCSFALRFRYCLRESKFYADVYIRQDIKERISHTIDKDAILQLAIRGAEVCMDHAKAARKENWFAELFTKLQHFTELGEEVKKDPQWKAHKDRFGRENSIIHEGTKLNGLLFPPWTCDPDHSQFKLQPDQRVFTDSFKFHLSDSQQRILKGWNRAAWAVPPPAWFPEESQRTKPSMDVQGETDLVQDAATDCSVVASLCADSARTARGHGRIIPSRIHPYDTKSRTPQISSNGKYVAKFHFNGCDREVIIDDCLPVSKTHRSIHVVDRQNPALLWPALIEKAYLKLWGGYDFPGSNSGTDLWVLTGWIPQQVFLHSDEINPSLLWNRMFKAFDNGDVLVTMGTGKMSDKLEHDIGLAGEHDYAVLDLQEKDGQRLLLLKNPWCEGTCWKGNFSNLPQLETRKMERPGREKTSLVGSEQETQTSLKTETGLRPGTFWIDLESVLQYFESIYLNWNPAMFSHRRDDHFKWHLGPRSGGLKRATGSLLPNPQFVITSTVGQQVWLLLSRHFSSTKEQLPGEQTPRYLKAEEEFISLCAFLNGGTRAYLSEGSIKRGPYVDSPQTLLCLEIEPNMPYTVAFCEQGLKDEDYNFTFSAFSTSPITKTKAPALYPHRSSVQGWWNRSSAGGSTNSPSYIANPQFVITLKQKTPLAIILLSPSNKFHVHVKLMHNSQRADRIKKPPSRRDIIIDSGEYRKGSALAKLPSELDAGMYTVICSTYEPGQMGEFYLEINSMTPTSIRRIPGECTSQFRKHVDIAGFRNGAKRMASLVTPKRLTRLAIIAKRETTHSSLEQPGIRDHPSQDAGSEALQTHSLLQMSLESGQSPIRKHLAASSHGQYADVVDATYTDDVDLWPEMLSDGPIWLILDRIGEHLADEVFNIEMFTDIPDGISFGSWQVWK